MFAYTCLLLAGVAFGGSSASSTLKNDKGFFKASKAVDGLLQTGWAEAVDGSGEGQWWELDLGRATKINTLSIWPGNLSKGTQSFRLYSRPRLIRIMIDGKQSGNPVRLKDKVHRRDIRINKTGRKVRIVIDKAFPGGLSSDLFIAEVAVNLKDKKHSKSIQRYLKGKSGQKKTAQYNAVLDRYAQSHKNSELSDRNALQVLCKAAADGPIHLQKMASSVPDGYRVQAIPSSDHARKKLRILRDSNAIKCLELAALRTTGKESQRRWSNVQYFYALQDYIGGPNYNVKAWGEKGWSKGELQSFGEPLPLEIDQFGAVWVVDTGNNRIQQFDEKGRMKKLWGGKWKKKEDRLTRQWFDRNRPWYISGSKPGSKGSSFVNPLDIALIESKKGTGFAVLDAKGKITLFDDRQQAKLSWKVEHLTPATAGQGGTGYLIYIKKKQTLCAIIQDQGSCYRLDSEKVGKTWDIKDGTPGAVQVMPNGKILMAFNDQIVNFSSDGFRHRTLINKRIIGDGFEYLDMTYDEKGKLWIVTDNGDLFKFKKPGKLEFKLKLTEYSLKYPRIAVQDDFLYLLSEDKIQTFDIKQIRLDNKEKQK